MSILTGDLSPREGVLCVDSLASGDPPSIIDDAQPFHVAKAFTVPHLGMVFGTRGAAAFPAWLLVVLNNRRLADFDQFRAEFSDICGDAHKAALGVLDGYGQFRGVEALAMGWSPAQRRVVGIYAKNIAGDGVVRPDEFDSAEVLDEFAAQALPDGTFALPGIEADELHRAMARHRKMGPERMVALAKAQRADVDRKIGPGMIGGRLYAFTVTRHAVEARMLYEWPQEKAQDGIRAAA